MVTKYVYGFRKCLLELRAKLGLSQQELAERLKIAQSTLVRWESRNTKVVRTWDNYLDAFRREYKKAFGCLPELVTKTNVNVGRKAVGRR